MDKQNAGKMFYKMNSQLNLHSYDIAVNTLEYICNDLYPAFCIPTSHEYNQTYVQTIVFYFTIDLIENQNIKLQQASQHFLHRWSNIISSISPLDFIQNIQGLFAKDQSHSNLFYIFLPALGNAISLLGDDEILHNFSFIQKLFHIVSQTKIDEIPTQIWQVIGKYSTEDEITQILQNNLEISFASISPNLIQKNPKKFTNFLFKNASSDYLIEFLNNCNPSYRIDIDEAINKVSRDCTELGHAGFNSTCLMLANFLHFFEFDFSDEQKTRIENLLKKLFEFLSDDKINANDTNSILFALFEGAKKNLFEKESLKKLTPNIQFLIECQQLQITYLKISILCMEKDSDNSNAFRLFEQFQPCNDQIYIQYLNVVGENFLLLKEISQNSTIHLLWSIFHPLPLEANVAVSIVKLLLSFDPEDVLDSRVDARLDSLFDSYFKLGNSELTKLTLKLAKLYKYSPPVTKIDLFRKFNENYLSLLTNVDPNLIKELIQSKLLEPSSRHCIVSAMQNRPSCYIEYVASLTNIVYSFGKALGIRSDIDSSLWKVNLKKPEIEDDIISYDEIKELFEKINGPIEESDFGNFLSASLNTLASLISNDSNRSKIHQNDIAKVALISSHFVCICPKQVLSLLARLLAFRASKNDSENHTEAECYREVFRIVESVHIPMKFSIDFVLYSNARYGGFGETIKRFPKYVNEALAKSRKICDMLQKEIRQPLQPMKTFLSFVGIQEHKEWVDVCQQVIPPHDWIVRQTDAKVINDMKNLSEESKRILAQKLEKIKNKPKPTSQKTESFLIQSSSFHITRPLHITPAPKIHQKDNQCAKPSETENNQSSKNLDGTITDVISFLWHSRLELPESIKIKDLENLALEHSSNAKMLVSFFTWSNCHNYKINLDDWKDKISLSEFTEMWLLAVAMLASNIHCSFSEIPTSIMDVFQKCFTSFGYPKITKKSLVNGYYHLTGVKWLIARNIISIDPSYFSEYPLIVAEVTKNMDLFKKYFDDLDTENSKEVNFFSFVGINDIIFTPTEEEMIQTSLFPTNFTFNDRILSFKEISRIPKQIEIPNELLESIINCLQKAKDVSYNYFQFFMNIKMSNEQFSRVHDIFFKNRESSDMNRKYFLPSLFVSETGKSAYLEDEAIRFYSNKPPSLTRAFYRSLLCRFAPPVNQDLIIKIESKLEKVFPDLCYHGIRMWETALPITKLRFGCVDKNTVSSLLNDMKFTGYESLFVYENLCKLSDEKLAVAQHWATNGMIRDEISRALLDTVTSECSNAFFALEAASLICDSIGIDNAMILIANKDFLERPNFLCAIICFVYLLKRARNENNQNVLNFMQMIQNPETNIIDDENKKTIFSSYQTDDSLSNLIHCNY